MTPCLLRQLQQLILLQPGAEILEQPHCAPGDDVTPVIGQLQGITGLLLVNYSPDRLQGVTLELD